MSNESEASSEYESNQESSQGSSEYHSGQEPELDRKQIILINRDEEFTFLKIQFPMPHQYPHLYIKLNELMTIVNVVPKSYDRITDITRDPNHALGYIITTSISTRYHELFELSPHITSIKSTI